MSYNDDLHSLSPLNGIVNIMWFLHQNIEEKHFKMLED